MHSPSPAAGTTFRTPQLLRGAQRPSRSHDFGIYAVHVSTGQAGGASPRWLVIDNSGRIVARAHSELLAIAKMQILRLTELASPTYKPLPDEPRVMSSSAR